MSTYERTQLKRLVDLSAGTLDSAVIMADQILRELQLVLKSTYDQAEANSINLQIQILSAKKEKIKALASQLREIKP